MPLRAAAVAAAALVFVPAPAHAAIPEEAVLLHAKEHEETALTWTDEGARLSADSEDLWSFVPVEALLGLGGHLVVHEDTGQCLSAESMEDGATTAPVTLLDCAESDPWTVGFDTNHEDLRFQTPEGHYLGASREEADGDVEVIAEEVPSSMHAHEWLTSILPAEPPASSEPPVSDSPSDPEPAAQPQLPQTGVGLGALGAGGLIAVAAGTALTMWWRRHSLRTQW